MSGTARGIPLALRLSVTERCQLRCVYCRPGHGRSPPDLDTLGVDELVRFVDITRRRFGVSKVRLTGGEPLVRRDIVAIVGRLARLGLPDLALTTNGQRLASLAAPLRDAGLRRVNVSLDSLREDTFAALAGAPGRDRTVAGIDAALRSGLQPLKLNAVLLRGANDGEAEALLTFALERGCEARFIELMPTGLSPEQYARWHVPGSELLARLARSFDIVPMPFEAGSSSRRFGVRDARGRSGVVGLITPMSHPFCGGCRRLRLTSGGHLVGCLGRTELWPLAASLRTPGDCGEAAVVDTVNRALACKRSTQAFEPALRMSAIGG